MSKSPSVLKLSNISKIYPGVIALKDINLNVEKGEVHGLIGKNGAGKSTLVNIVSGVIVPTEGEIQVADKTFTYLTRMGAQENGISIVTQDAQLIPDFTVAETLFSPNLLKKKGLIDWKTIYAKAQSVVDETNFKVDVSIKNRDLSVSFQKFILLIKSFYIDDSSIVILDEVSASISPKDQHVLFDIVREAKSNGKTILYITHRMEEIKQICDRVTILRDGRSIATEECGALSPEKLTSYIIGQAEYKVDVTGVADTKAKLAGAKTICSVKELTSIGRFANISFEVKKGEILGLAGLRGSGRTEILRTIAGMDKFDSGSIEFEGVERVMKTPWETKEAGIVYLTEDRDTEGLVLNHTVERNLLLSVLKKFIKRLFISLRQESVEAEALIKKVNIKAHLMQEVQTLSGGNRQKVVIGKVISCNPKLLLLDEPTKGIDIDAINSVLKFIKEELSESMAIVITSPGLGELVHICDRILVISEGKIVDEFFRGEFNEEKIYALM
ncbi:MAG: sugar ABC transporter ATP-binding protein [Deltaproteobacteria bacterium]|jgi:ABC-type sugar transport system ATPase subunit|nr:sugar ABC transporter ATP-binding protein [Deltaproteobacteria bacterium]